MIIESPWHSGISGEFSGFKSSNTAYLISAGLSPEDEADYYSSKPNADSVFQTHGELRQISAPVLRDHLDKTNKEGDPGKQTKQKHGMMKLRNSLHIRKYIRTYKPVF